MKDSSDASRELFPNSKNITISLSTPGLARNSGFNSNENFKWAPLVCCSPSFVRHYFHHHSIVNMFLGRWEKILVYSRTSKNPKKNILVILCPKNLKCSPRVAEWMAQQMHQVFLVSGCRLEIFHSFFLFALDWLSTLGIQAGRHGVGVRAGEKLK